MNKELFDKMFNTTLSKRMNVYLNQNRNKNSSAWMIASGDKSQRPSAHVIEDYKKAKTVYSIKIDNDTIWQMQQLLVSDARTPTMGRIIKWFKEAYNITSEVILVDQAQDRGYFEDSGYGLYQSHRKTAITYYLATNFDSFELTEHEQEVVAKEKRAQAAHKLYNSLIKPSIKNILTPIGFENYIHCVDTEFETSIDSYASSILKDYVMKLIHDTIDDKLKALGFEDYKLRVNGHIDFTIELDPNHNLAEKMLARQMEV